MRNNRYLLFGGMGFLGGNLGALVAETVCSNRRGSVLSMAAEVSVWAAVFTAVLCLGLFWAIEIYNRKPGVPWPLLRKAAFSGALAGAIGGGIAQLVFSLRTESPELKQFLLRPACWGIAGALVGWRFSKVIPNLGAARGFLAGGVGGVLGGYAFIFSCLALPELLGRMLGVGLMGAALGLAIVVTELLFRQAALEVIWAPKEITSLTLGRQPIYIGGGDDHIHVAGLPQHAASITFEQGKIEYSDGATGEKTTLKSNSQIKIGTIEIRVRAQT